MFKCFSNVGNVLCHCLRIECIRVQIKWDIEYSETAPKKKLPNQRVRAMFGAHKDDVQKPKKKLKMKKWEVKQLVALLIDRMHIKVSYGELTEK